MDLIWESYRDFDIIGSYSQGFSIWKYDEVLTTVDSVPAAKAWIDVFLSLHLDEEVS